MSPETATRLALVKLREARDLLKVAGAKRAATMGKSTRRRVAPFGTLKARPIGESSHA